MQTLRNPNPADFLRLSPFFKISDQLAASLVKSAIKQSGCIWDWSLFSVSILQMWRGPRHAFKVCDRVGEEGETTRWTEGSLLSGTRRLPARQSVVS